MSTRPFDGHVMTVDKWTAAGDSRASSGIPTSRDSLLLGVVKHPLIGNIWVIFVQGLMGCCV